MNIKTKPTRSGIKKYLKQIHRFKDHELPPLIQEARTVESWTAEEASFAEYMVYDNDFGGCWNDPEQISMHTVA